MNLQGNQYEQEQQDETETLPMSRAEDEAPATGIDEIFPRQDSGETVGQDSGGDGLQRAIESREYYRSQAEVDRAFSKRIAAQRAKWERERDEAIQASKDCGQAEDTENGEEQDFPQAQQETEQEQEKREFLLDIGRQAEVFKQSMPCFDMSREISGNEDFRSLLAMGVSVEQAYKATSEEYVAFVREQAQQEVVKNIRVRNLKPAPISPSHAASAEFDVDLLTPSQFEEIDRRVKRGERVKL